MSKITQIINGESGLNSRNKINEAMKTVETTLKLTGDGNVGTELDIDESQLDFGIIQEKLVSGTNIKSVNGESLLGAGDLEVSAGSGGYAANVYFTNLVSTTVGTYKQVSYTPDVAETIVTAIANNNEVLLEDYIFDGDVKTTIVPAGEWSFIYNGFVDNIGQTSKFRFEVFSRTSGGIETVLFSVDGQDVDNTTRERKSVFSTQGQFNVNETDRLGIKVYVNTTRTSNTTFSFIVGDGDASFFTTPLEIRHSQLRARDEADSHPISAITNLQTTLDGKQNILSEGAFVDGDKTKLDGIAAGAEVNTINSDPTGVTGADIVSNVISLTQAEYDAIGTPNVSTFYLITDA